MSYDLGTAHGKIELDYDGGRAAEQADDDIKRIERSAKDTDVALTRMGRALSAIGKGAGITGLAIGLTNGAAAAGAATVQILGMVPALTSIGSLAAALPAAFVAGAASAGVLKAAFVGLDEVASSVFEKDPAKFNEAIKALAPSARAAAQGFRDIVPQLQAVQQGIQQAFFDNNFEALFPRLVAGLQSLQPNLNGLAGQFGGLARQVVAFGTESRSVDFINNSIASLRASLENLSPNLDRLMSGLRSVGEVGLPLFGNMGQAVTNLAGRFGDWLNSIASDGRLTAWIEQGVATLQSLGGILSNVGSILTSVFQAAEASGGGLLNTIEQVTGQFATFLNSTQGQEAITALFTGILAAAQALAPVVTTLAGALAGALGPALARIATELGPVLLDVVQRLAPAFGPLAMALADILVAVAPLLPPLAQLIALLASQAASGISAFASALGPVVQMLGGALATSLAQLMPVITQLAIQVLPVAAQAGLQLAQAFAPLVPAFIQLGQTLASNLLPVLPQLVSAFIQLIPSAVQLASVFANGLAQSLLAIVPLLPPLISGFVAVLPWFVQGATFAMQLAAAILSLSTRFGGLIGSVQNVYPAMVGAVGNAFRAAWGLVTSIGGQIMGWFSALPGRVGAFLSALPGIVMNLFSNAINGAARAFGAGIGIVLTLAIGVPRRIGSALASLVTIIPTIARNAWNAARAAFSAGVSAAVSFAAQLPGRVRGAISALAGNLRSVAVAGWNALRSAFSSGVSQAASIAASLPGRIRSAVGNLGGILVGAGRDAVMGLVSGLRGAIGAAVSAAASVGQSVISGIKSTLRISSPSREMILIGRYVGQGLVAGLRGSEKQVRAATAKLGNMVRDAFGDGVSRRARDSVLRTLSSGQRTLLKLVRQRETVAARLKAAQATLKTTTDAYNKTSADTATKIRDSFKLVTPGQQFVDVNLVRDRLRATVNVAKQFGADMAKLAKRGLNKDLLAQLAEAGAADGGTMARALANSTDAQLRELNSLAGQLSTTATSTGKVVADSLYGAGVRAAQGLVKGLQAQQKAIDAQMNRIAVKMAAAIKKALKIKSPSRVFRGIGQDTGAGLLAGLLDMRRQVTAAARTLANSAIAPTVRLGATGAVAGYSRPTVASTAGAAGPGLVVQQTVNALPGQNARQVADYGITRLTLALKTGVGVVSLPAPTPQGA